MGIAAVDFCLLVRTFFSSILFLCRYQERFWSRYCALWFNRRNHFLYFFACQQNLKIVADWSLVWLESNCWNWSCGSMEFLGRAFFVQGWKTISSSDFVWSTSDDSGSYQESLDLFADSVAVRVSSGCSTRTDVIFPSFRSILFSENFFDLFVRSCWGCTQVWSLLHWYRFDL